MYRGIMWIPIFLMLLSSAVSLGISCCAKKDRVSFFLDTAMDMMSKLKSENISCLDDQDLPDGKNMDCADWYERGYNKSGVYSIWPNSRVTLKKPINVFCDMTTEGGGWTVIQRRGNFGRGDDYFIQDWENYKKGFGDIQRDFWLGNDNIFAMTSQKLCTVRFELEDSKKSRGFAHYDTFWIDDEFNKYTLHISGYKGNAGDAMKRHDKSPFSTKERNHNNNCGSRYQSGWWFENCYDANLNGRYNNPEGINWHPFRNKEFLPRAEIKIRPSEF